MRLAPTACLAACVLSAAPVLASPQTDALYEALAIDEVLEVMREEGLGYGDDLERDLLGGSGGPTWDALVDGLYDTGRMGEVVREEFAQQMDGVDTAPLLDYFQAPLGQRIVRLETEARAALNDKAVEAAAGERIAALRDAGDPRIDLLDAFVETNELVDANVVGAMNSNFAFFSGLLEAGPEDSEMTEEQALADVWSQEPQIRLDTAQWVYAYLGLAYEPLSDAELQSYIDLSATEEGQALNRALFGAFDEMYSDVSRALGRGAGRLMDSQDI